MAEKFLIVHPDWCVSIGQVFSNRLLTNQNISNMNIMEFLSRVMSDDETKHGFTNGEKFMYGVLVPLGFMAVMCVAGWLETCAE